MDWIEGNGLREWLAARLKTANDIVLVSPYITAGGLAVVRNGLRRRKAWQSLTIVTRLDPMSAALDVLDIHEIIATISELAGEGREIIVRDCSNLHAKVFVIDGDSAVVGSGNLTLAGTSGGNFELGVKLARKSDVAELATKIAPLLTCRQVSPEELERFQNIVDRNFADVKVALTRSGWGRLEIIPGCDGDYYQALRKVLAPVVKKPRSVDFVKRLLRNKELGEDNSESPRRRLLFLEYLGLIDHKSDNLLYVTDLGLTVSKRSGISALASLLIDRYTIISRVYEGIRRDETKYYTYNDLARELSIPLPVGNVRSDEFDQMQDAVRWLFSLGLAERDSERADGGFLRFRAKKTRPKSHA